MRHWLSDPARWLRSRFPVDQEALTAIGSEPIPGHLRRWWWCIGGTPAYLFVVQIASGILLTFYYVPSPEFAYDSVAAISGEVRFGSYLRSIHKWSSHLMIIAMLLHMLRVFFTGAYRPPRELNWMVGCGLLLLTLGAGFTGYSLVWEQLSYWGATVAANILSAIPLLGDQLAGFLRGGDTVGQNMLTRLFVLHIGAIPTLMIGCLAIHIYLVRAHGVSELGSPKTSDSEPFPFFPNHFLTEVALALFLMFLLTCLALIFPADLGERANALETPEHIKPEWYFFWAFRWLKLMPDQVAVVTQGLFLLLVVLWPVIDGRIRKRYPASEISMAVGGAAVVLLLALTVWEALYLMT
ncbi:MAG: cytochrome bc complex cytochrome b subunit [Bryobacterales bacterium]|nr:cytochrome bc complex cytochrome b subunit [Bryobacterales bacterium]